MVYLRCPACNATVYREGASSEWVHLDWTEGFWCWWARLRRTGGQDRGEVRDVSE